jgi:trigger factor
MKKNIITLVSILLAGTLLFTACSGKDEPDNATGDENGVFVTSSETEIGWIDRVNESVDSSDAGFNYSHGMNNDGFWEGITASDFVSGLNYSGILIPAHIHTVTDEKVKEIIDNEILPFFEDTVHVFDRPVDMWDEINIDFVGSVDGVPFSGGNTEGMGADVTVGVTDYVDNFLLQLIGHAPGETVNVEVTFPDTYREESLAGKDALFVTTINYIVDSAHVELTDEFVMRELLMYFGTSTVAELEEFIKNDIRQWDINTFIMEYLSTNVTVTDIPDVVVEYHIEAFKERYRSEASQFGLEMEEFLDMFFDIRDMDDYFSIENSEIRAQAELSLIMQAIAESADIIISNEDLADYIMYAEFYGTPFLKNFVMQQRVVEYVTGLVVLE